MKNEIRKTYYDDGELEHENSYLDLKKHGRQLFFHKNGQISSDYYHRYDQCYGISKWFFNTGFMYELRQWKKDSMNGPKIMFMY